ncbi:MAG: isochorismatase family protein [Hydrogenophaga sp.]|uniref:cysteine hydrolase family protein n=1 Tax=Hydrogenophaga sp. TaxID=1904254 RepID=UPI0016B4772A|nr:cysteine hydrolase family protein [Hydrogenophaga sp.]NIM42880.1 isochorismatase family protein [Hydrogenophaga sp.]NIN27813.1 isochorismatase family protein [Hydrogenophaga sp.]NIN32632.1 isochorismatase family protein [Hydrogenophaga sp.]NIN57086.1 isochorismatase family protein [Hydrogenophaga sp.]NIO53497.1 isochorismatase family protein [Hydrogenophaga sp.]
MPQRALLVIDLQNEYFPTGKLPLVGIEPATANAARVIADARAKGVPVIHVRHEAGKPDAPVFTPGTPNVQIHPSVAPVEGEAVIVKHFPNSFRETPLKALLDEQGVRELTIVGAMSHMCIDAGTRAAADLGYAVTVVHDACATRDLVFGGETVPAAQVHAAYMAALGSSYAQVISTEAVLGR